MTGTPASWQVAQNVLRSISPLCTVWWERSEEHTSELQSQSNLVCRLLLEKNKTSAHPSSGDTDAAVMCTIHAGTLIHTPGVHRASAHLIRLGLHALPTSSLDHLSRLALLY